MENANITDTYDQFADLYRIIIARGAAAWNGAMLAEKCGVGSELDSELGRLARAEAQLAAMTAAYPEFAARAALLSPDIGNAAIAGSSA